MTREKLEKDASILCPMDNTAIVYILFVEEKKEQIIQTITKEDPKAIHFATMLKKVDTNPMQAVVVSSSMNDVDTGDLIYLNHRYYPYPIIHEGAIYHRVFASDIICKVIEYPSEIDRRLALTEGTGARNWNDEPIELTRKDVLT